GVGFPVATGRRCRGRRQAERAGVTPRIARTIIAAPRERSRSAAPRPGCRRQRCLYGSKRAIMQGRGAHSGKHMIVLFTDFGLHGPYTGQMRAVLHRMAPGIPTIDLFADAPAGNPKASAYLLPAYADCVASGHAL